MKNKIYQWRFGKQWRLAHFHSRRESENQMLTFRVVWMASSIAERSSVFPLEPAKEKRYNELINETEERKKHNLWQSVIALYKF